MPVLRIRLYLAASHEPYISITVPPKKPYLLRTCRDNPTYLLSPILANYKSVGLFVIDLDAICGGESNRSAVLIYELNAFCA